MSLGSCDYSKNKNNLKSNSFIQDTIFIHDTLQIVQTQTDDWQIGFGLTHTPNIDSVWGKPVSYYINDKACNSLSIDFYYGYMRPSDNGATIELLKLACTDNNKLRPFYRWCLNKTLLISDGALAELVGVPARQYAEKFPDEFFEYMDNKKDNNQYEIWTEEIQYSGFFDYPEFDDIEKLKKEHIKRMSLNLKNKTDANLNRIKKFAEDCQKV